MVSIVEQECEILTILCNQESHLLAVGKAKFGVGGACFDTVLPHITTIVFKILTGK
jgi:hypothetical protein